MHRSGPVQYNMLDDQARQRHQQRRRRVSPNVAKGLIILLNITYLKVLNGQNIWTKYVRGWYRPYPSSVMKSKKYKCLNFF